jgi:fructokinase
MIACYGEALVDLFVSPYSQGELRTDSQACLGGSVFNFCLAAQRQGLDSLYLNALSVDSFGRQFDHLLQKEGVQLDAKPCSEPTSMAVIQLDVQGKASYAFHRNAVADTARSAHEIVAHWRSEVSLLHTGCLMLAPSSWDQTRQIIAHAVAQGSVISVDANLRPAAVSNAKEYARCVREACHAAHVLKFSDDDLVALGLLNAQDVANTNAVCLVAQKFLSSHNASSATQLIALTLGERGACLLTRTHTIIQAVPKGVTVKDTVGAGDSFAAALLAHLHSQKLLSVEALSDGLTEQALQTALRHATAAASICVQRMGCDPASWGEAEILAKQML